MALMPHTAAILIIGNEILSGRTKDTNLSYAAQKLGAHGVRVMEARVIPDIEPVIVDTVRQMSAAHGALLTSGGIGPTHDDITSECIAKAFGRVYGLHPEAEPLLRAHYGDQATPARMKMAKMPVDATLIPNPVSAAPGFVVENVYVMAGVPSVFQAMCDWVVPRLPKGEAIISRAISAHLPESKLADALEALQRLHPAVDIGSYPQMQDGKPATTVVARGTNAAEIDVIIDAVRIAMQALTDRVVEGEFSRS